MPSLFREATDEALAAHAAAFGLLVDEATWADTEGEAADVAADMRASAKLCAQHDRHESAARLLARQFLSNAAAGVVASVYYDYVDDCDDDGDRECRFGTVRRAGPGRAGPGARGGVGGGVREEEERAGGGRGREAQVADHGGRGGRARGHARSPLARARGGDQGGEWEDGRARPRHPPANEIYRNGNVYTVELTITTYINISILTAA